MRCKAFSIFGVIFAFWMNAATAETPEVLDALVSIGCLEGAEGASKLKLRTAVRCYQKASNVDANGQLTPAQRDALLALIKSGRTLDVPIRYTLPNPKPPTVLVGGDFSLEIWWVGILA